MSQPFAEAEAFSLCDFQVVLQTVKEIKAWSSRAFSQILHICIIWNSLF